MFSFPSPTDSFKHDKDGTTGHSDILKDVLSIYDKHYELVFFEGRDCFYDVRITYNTPERVDISFPLNPYDVLDVPPTASREDIKQSFRDKINQQPSREGRVKITIANHILTTTTDRYKKKTGNMFSIGKLDHLILAAAGDTQELASRIDKENVLDKEDEHKRTPLYLACKSGVYDTVEMLLTRGASINKTQIDGSTPLHAAAYFGHKNVVGLLLEHGASTNIKNRWGNSALDESRTEEIKSLIRAASEDPITSRIAQFREKGLVKIVRFVEERGEVIGKELVLNSRILDACTRAQWECVWHGTEVKKLPSILENGLLPPGSGGFEPLDGHIKLGLTFNETPNWAAAIFVSPSIRYASQYSKLIEPKPDKWCVLLKALCKPGSYQKFISTLRPPYEPVSGEPEELEYRVDKKENIVVQSVLFVQSTFLQRENVQRRQLPPEYFLS